MKKPVMEPGLPETREIEEEIEAVICEHRWHQEMRAVDIHGATLLVYKCVRCGIVDHHTEKNGIVDSIATRDNDFCNIVLDVETPDESM